jgi:hypothetical protein
MRTTALGLIGILLFAGVGVACGAEGTEEIVKLAQSGLSEDVLVAYVEASPTAYDLSADNLVYLNDLGIPERVLTAMLSHAKDPGAAANLALGTVSSETPGDPAPASVEPASLLAAEPAPIYEATPMAEPASNPGLQIAQSTVVAPADGTTDISYFYTSLAPYGSWVSEPDYGWVWQPTAVALDATWQPYRQGGQWVWTDYGWYWQSSYTWGWAPFHYGRWAYSSRHRWVWVPDNVWGPAWVNWRCSDDAYGWAPLPPGSTWDAQWGFSFRGEHVGFDFDFHLGHDHYTFVPRRHFLERNLGAVAFSRQQAMNTFSRTSSVNHSYARSGNRIINQGIPVQSVAEVTQRKIEPRHVVDLHPEAGRSFRGGRVANDQIAAFRPNLQEKASADPPTVLARHAKELGRQRPTSGTPLTLPATTQPGDRKTAAAMIVRPTEKSNPAKPAVALPPVRSNELRNGKTADTGRLTNPTGKDQADAQLRTQQDAAHKAVDQQAQNAQRSKQQDAARKLADQQAQRAKEQDAARRQQEATLRAQQDAARKLADQQAQNAQRAKEQDAARRQQEATLRAQQEAARKLADQQAQSAQRAKEQEAARRQQQDAARKLADQQAQNAQRAKEQAAARRQQEVQTPPAPQRQAPSAPPANARTTPPAPQRQTPSAPPANARTTPPSAAPASDPKATEGKAAKGRGKR